jgi:MOSC domain-containing protein YiiM
VINAYRGQQPNEFGDGLNFGVYAEVVTPGTVRLGDEVSFVERP